MDQIPKIITDAKSIHFWKRCTREVSDEVFQSIFSHVSARMLLIAVWLILKAKLRNWCDSPLSRYCKELSVCLVILAHKMNPLTLHLGPSINKRYSHWSGDIPKSWKKYSKSNISSSMPFPFFKQLLAKISWIFFSLWNFSSSRRMTIETVKILCCLLRMNDYWNR